MVEYDPFSDQILDDPFPVYRRLRDEAPVYYVESLNSWALSRFEDVWNAGEDPTTFASPGPDPQTPGRLSSCIKSFLLPQSCCLAVIAPGEGNFGTRALSGFRLPRRLRGGASGEGQQDQKGQCTGDPHAHGACLA